ncbi:MAG TPA: SUF system NifU family Fe-S cluster assembly protein [Kofleriaceae bacterium]|nr:SUF system NifU family Fe-S cluster assembly protein [Kofleriaceae bacterium]
MSDVDDLYQATIVEHDRAPRNHGPLPGATHQATADNPLCGDVVTVRAQITDGVVSEIAFEGRGCALSRAAASIMTTMVRDHTVEDARRLAAAFELCVQSAPDAAIPDELGDLRSFAGVRRFRSRRVCALLPFHALVDALAVDT